MKPLIRGKYEKNTGENDLEMKKKNVAFMIIAQ